MSVVLKWLLGAARQPELAEARVQARAHGRAPVLHRAQPREFDGAVLQFIQQPREHGGELVRVGQRGSELGVRNTRGVQRPPDAVAYAVGRWSL